MRGVNMETLGERIKKLRLAHGLTQRELAKKIGASPGLISFIERDRNKPSYEIIRRISNVLGTTTDYLISGKLSHDKLDELLEKARVEVSAPFYLDGKNSPDLTEREKELLSQNVLARLAKLNRVDLKIILGILEQIEKRTEK
jgi:transcriptional regulator with XRE-family HTH domain